jgi:hypothetical protein
MALAAGLTPNRLSKLQSRFQEDPDSLSSLEINQLKRSQKIYAKFIKTFEGEKSPFLFENEHYAGFNHLWVKWLAENEIFPFKTFFSSISPTLKWIYFEFQPRRAALRKAHKTSQAYHKAYFLECIEYLLSELEDKQLRPKEIYDLPQAKNILRQIRDWGGAYDRRTIIESWLPDLLGKSKRGRPNKKKA